MKFGVIGGNSGGYKPPEPNRHGLSREVYSKLFGLIKEWSKIYGQFMAKPQEVAKIVDNDEFRAVVDFYKESEPDERESIEKCLLGRVNVGDVQDLILYYGCKGNIPEGYDGYHMGLIGNIPKMQAQLDSVLGDDNA